jgi:hypothetical protein
MSDRRGEVPVYLAAEAPAGFTDCMDSFDEALDPIGASHGMWGALNLLGNYIARTVYNNAEGPEEAAKMAQYVALTVQVALVENLRRETKRQRH